MSAERILWIFGSERTGSTWLSAMMASLSGHAVWDEPLVGLLFGDFLRRTAAGHSTRRARDYIFGDHDRERWLGSVRRFVLDEASARFPGAETLAIKEPNGSVGAPLLMEAMPESGLIVLVRDPRDAVSSSLAAHRRGGWLYEWSGEARHNRWGGRPDDSPDAFVQERARFYAANVQGAREAYASHSGRKILIRYEDLRVNTLEIMTNIYSAMEMRMDVSELATTVEVHSWDRVPDRDKGEGKFYRKAEPGSWRDDLTPRQARIVEKTTAPLIDELYAN